MENLERERSLMEADLNTKLAARAKSISESIAHIERNNAMLDDYPVYLPQIQYEYRNDRAEMLMNVKTEFGSQLREFSLHQHAVEQIGTKMGVPPAYLRDLAFGPEMWQRQLAVLTMQEHNAHSRRERVLIRTVDGQVRGYLSDKYRRLNTMQIFLAFLMAARDHNSVLVSAHNSDTKDFLEVIQPKVIELDTPFNGKHFLTIGARIRKSDFGDGALDLSTYIINVRCLNGMIGKSMLHEVHLGGRIPDNIKISEETYRKDTEAVASLTSDIMRQIYHPENVELMLGRVQTAATQRIDLMKEVEALPKLGLTIGEKEAVGKILMNGSSDDSVQGDPTLWKLVNGLTAVAREAAPERKRELEIIAGTMLAI